MKFVFGLGNPGRKYDSTRHNIGFRVLDTLIQKDSKKWGTFEKQTQRSGHQEVEYLIASRQSSKEEAWYLIKPLTFMNLSGFCVCEVLKKWAGQGPVDFLVVCDEVYLKFGQLRFRPEGSAGGHNGLKSVIEVMQTESFERLRIGVGQESVPHDFTNFVLTPFSQEEEKVMKGLLDETAGAVETWLRYGIEKTMNQYNANKKL